MTKTQVNTTNESQEVTPFPADDHKAAMNRCKTITNTSHRSKMIHKRYTALERSVNKYFTGRIQSSILKPYHKKTWENKTIYIFLAWNQKSPPFIKMMHYLSWSPSNPHYFLFYYMIPQVHIYIRYYRINDHFDKFEIRIVLHRR